MAIAGRTLARFEQGLQRRRKAQQAEASPKHTLCIRSLAFSGLASGGRQLSAIDCQSSANFGTKENGSPIFDYRRLIANSEIC